MATVACFVANRPILLRNPLRASSGRESVSFSSSAPEFPVDLKLHRSFFSTAETSLGRHASLCKPPNCIKDHLGIGKPLGRVGGKWSTEYPIDPRSRDPSEPFSVSLIPGVFVAFAPLICYAPGWPIWFRTLALITFTTLLAQLVRSCLRVSVVKLQVGFSGQGRDLEFDLHRIAETAETSTYEGLGYCLNEVIVAMLRHSHCYISSSISVVSKYSRISANTYIDELSINERVRNTETLVNVNNIKFQCPSRQKSANDLHNDDIMVTLLVGARQKLDLPTINNKSGFENVLQLLRFIGSSNNMTAIEVLWTPHVSSCLARTCA